MPASALDKNNHSNQPTTPINSAQSSGSTNANGHSGLDAAESENLTRAFHTFNELSSQLSTSYESMQQQVSYLTREMESLAASRLVELQQKEKITARLESLLNLMPAGVVVLDKKGEVNQANPAAESLLGEPLTGERWLDIIQRSFAPQKDDGHEISLKDGRKVSVATRSLEDYDSQLLLLTDLTETRKLQQQFNQHQRLLEMGRMIASLAHQIRTPLAAAMLYTGHLCDQALPSEQVNLFADKVMSRLLHLEKQVNDMLIFVRGDVVIDDEVNGQQFISAVQQALDTQLSRTDLDMSIDTSHAFSKNVFLCNKDALVGAVSNLANNAVDATQHLSQAKIVISADITTTETGDWVVLVVDDNGQGMSAEQLEALHEPFFTTKPQGTGLGVAIVKAVAEAHRGDLQITSTANEGSRFCMRFPVDTLTR